MITLETVSPTSFRILRLGARYALRRVGEEHPGQWVLTDQPLPVGHEDELDEATARALVPLLRQFAERTRAGRPLAKPLTPNRRLIWRLCRDFDTTQGALAKVLRLDPGRLSKGEWPALYQQVLRAELVRKKEGTGQIVTYPMIRVFKHFLEGASSAPAFQSLPLFRATMRDLRKNQWVVNNEVTTEGRAVYDEWVRRVQRYQEEA